jgi:glycosyltransferase involved in cell wall biosynthesis
VARAAVFTLDPSSGGVPALARSMCDVLRAAGHTPTLVYRATDDVPVGSRIRTIAHFLSRPPIRRVVHDGIEAMSLAAYPLAPRHQYHALRLARRWVRAPIATVVSGSSHVGLARALSRRPYVLWTATMYGDELRARREAGDAWAAALLDSRDWPILEAQERLVYERASVILAASPYTRSRLVERWPELDGRVRDVCHPVDTDRFRPARVSESPVILLTARIRDRRKNVEMLIRAFARLRIAHPSARLVVAGDEPDADTRALVAAHHLEAVTEFPGRVDPDALLHLYQRASIFALPSRQEGLGISVQEAMACGVPVVSTRCGGPESLVVDGDTGYLVPNGDTAAMAAALGSLLADLDRRARMGAAGRARALALFSRERVRASLSRACADAFGDIAFPGSRDAPRRPNA